MKRVSLLLVVLLLLAITAAAQEATPEMAAGQSAVASLMDAEGNPVGEVVLTSRQDGKVAISVMVVNLPPGFHGFHVHSVGDCDPASDPPFSSAGGHLNPDGSEHPNHAGDLPSLLVNEDGTGELIAVTDRFTLTELFDGDGTAFMVHETADNFANIPERYGAPDTDTLEGGDSGSRIACGAVGENTAAG